MRIALGKFARSAIEARLGPDVRCGIVAALLYYARHLQSGQLPMPPPRFHGGWRVAMGLQTFELQLGPQTRAVLEREACKYQVSLNQILVHAVFVFLADLDANIVQISPSTRTGKEYAGSVDDFSGGSGQRCLRAEPLWGGPAR